MVAHACPFRANSKRGGGFRRTSAVICWACSWNDSYARFRSLKMSSDFSPEGSPLKGRSSSVIRGNGGRSREFTLPNFPVPSLVWQPLERQLWQFNLWERWGGHDGTGLRTCLRGSGSTSCRVRQPDVVPLDVRVGTWTFGLSHPAASGEQKLLSPQLFDRIPQFGRLLEFKTLGRFAHVAL